MRTITLQLVDGPLAADIYAAREPGDRPPVLLIHGWGGSGRYWRATIERLGDWYSCIVPDLPGVARSLPVRRGHNIFDQAQSIEALLAHLGITRAHVVGHSVGGAIAIVLAARRPELIERLVLTAVGLFRNEAERAFFGAIMGVTGVLMRARAPWMADIPFLAQQSAQRYFYRVPDDPQLLREGLLDYLTMDYDTAVACARSAVSDAIPAAARRVQSPTLLIGAREDQSMPAPNVAYMAGVIPGCKLRWITQCGHLPMVEKPDEYARIVREFLEAV